MSNVDEQNDIDNFNSTKYIDPYPDIPCALLNSADLTKYIKERQIIEPFDDEMLKAATYQGCIGGEYVFWNEEGLKKKGIISKRNPEFELAPNSIAFLPIDLKFRLPAYMVARFNLKVDHAYKGLLLGTGPIIDPGFYGKIFIPLHNFTNNPYLFRYGDVLIQLEFTKTSQVTDENNDIKDGYISFKSPQVDKVRSIGDFIEEAIGNDDRKRVLSSIPAAINETRKNAENAEKHVKRLALGAIIGVIIALAGFFFPLYDFHFRNSNKIEQALLELKDKHYQIFELQQRIKELENRQKPVVEKTKNEKQSN